MIELGANIDSKDDFGITPLNQAARSNSLDVARLLIEHGANIDLKDDFGFTPLHTAAKENSIDFARLMIKLGANPEGIDLSWMDDQEDGS